MSPARNNWLTVCRGALSPGVCLFQKCAVALDVQPPTLSDSAYVTSFIAIAWSATRQDEGVCT